jgi:hypothetical protein
MQDNIFSDDFNKTTDKIVKMYDNFIIMGDMNFNMLDDVKNVTLRGTRKMRKVRIFRLKAQQSLCCMLF